VACFQCFLGLSIGVREEGSDLESQTSFQTASTTHGNVPQDFPASKNTAGEQTFPLHASVNDVMYGEIKTINLV
jgi:hypothetical protein